MESDVWHPGLEWFKDSNLAALMRQLGTPTYDDLLTLSVDFPERYWDTTLEQFGIAFDPPATAFVDASEGMPWPRFFPGAGFNFAAACISAPEGAGDRLAVSWEDERGISGTLTYDELNHRTRRFASGLQRLGIRPGDRVGFLFPNTAEAIITFLAIGYIGAISVPLYSGYGADAVARRMLDAGARCLIAADGFYRRDRYFSLSTLANEVRGLVPAMDQIVIVRREDAPPPAFSHHDWHGVENLGEADLAPAATAANDVFMVIYTSGTTGRPKGAVHVHAGFPLRVAQDVHYHFDFKPADRYFWMSDMGWMVGPFSICAALINKGTLVLYDGAPDLPDIGRLRAVAERHGVTHFGSSPTSVRAMAAAPELVLSIAAPALRVLMTGGEVMDAEAHHWYFQHFGGGHLPIINYSGGTEVSGAILTNVVLRDIKPSRFNSTSPGVRACVVDADGKPVIGAPGELAISQAFVGMTRGFWNDRDRYLETYWSRFPGLWMHGDLAEAEPDGGYLLIGRSDDVMKVSGRRVGPSEIESILGDSGFVLEAVAFGVPDLRSGEAMILMVVPKSRNPSNTDLENHVASLLRSKMGPAYKPQAVVQVPRLAKTRNGKLIRRLARNAWLGEPAGDLTSLEDATVFDDLVSACEQYRSLPRDKTPRSHP